MSVTPAIVNSIGDGDFSTRLVTWVLTSANPDGLPLEMLEWADRTVQMGGTWGTATGAIEGSNDGATWFALSNAAGATSLGGKTANFLATILELPRFMRPNLTTPGAGATVTVTLALRRANPMRT